MAGTRKTRGTRTFDEGGRTRDERREGVTAPWRRWSAYEIRNGVILPGSGAALDRYAPWDFYTYNPKQKSEERYPYLELVHLADRATSQQWKVDALTDEQEGEIVSWCASNGLLGVLPHRVEHVFLQPRWASRLHEPDIVQPTQVSFHKRHRWAEMRAMGPGEGGVEGALVDDAHLAGLFTAPGVLLRDLDRPFYRMEPFGQTWSDYFPSIPSSEIERFAYPAPLKDSFWEIYGEPVGAFLEGAHALRRAINFLQEPLDRSQGSREEEERMAAGIQVLEHLVDPAALYPAIGPDGHVVEQLGAPSLLASLGLMALQDLGGIRRIARCRTCGKPFVTSSPDGQNCSRECRWTGQKRQQKAKSRKKAKAPKKTKTRTRTKAPKTSST